MRLASVFASFVALVATSVLVAAVVKLRREVAETRAEVATLRESCQEAREGFPGADGDERARPAERTPERTVTAGPRLAPSAWAPTPGQPAVPSLASPEVKAEVKKLVAEQLADEQQQRQAEREQREQQRRERMAAELGLTEAEKERFLTVLGLMQAEWRQLREQERAGEKTMAELRPQMAAMREKTDQALRELLGEERMQKYQALSASQRGPGPGQGPSRPAPGGP
jgi:hypothetical protein